MGTKPEFLFDWNKKHNYSSPLPLDAMYEKSEESAQRLQRRNRLKMLTSDGRRTNDGYLYILKAHLSRSLRLR